MKIIERIKNRFRYSVYRIRKFRNMDWMVPTIKTKGDEANEALQNMAATIMTHASFHIWKEYWIDEERKDIQNLVKDRDKKTQEYYIGAMERTDEFFRSLEYFYAKFNEKQSIKNAADAIKAKYPDGVNKDRPLSQP